MSYPLNIIIPNPLFKVGKKVFAANKGEEDRYSHKAKIIDRRYIYYDRYEYGIWTYTVDFEAAWQSQNYAETKFEKVGNHWYVRSW